MFDLNLGELVDTLNYYNEGFAVLKEKNSTIESTTDPSLLSYPKGYSFNRATGYIEGPDNIRFKTLYRGKTT